MVGLSSFGAFGLDPLFVFVSRTSEIKFSLFFHTPIQPINVYTHKSDLSFLFAFWKDTYSTLRFFWISFHDFIASTSKYFLCFTKFLTTFLSPGLICRAAGRCLGAYRERLGWWRQPGGWNRHHTVAVGCIFRESGHRKGRMMHMERVSWLTAFTEPDIYGTDTDTVYPCSILYYHFILVQDLVHQYGDYTGSGCEVEEISF